MSFRIHFTRTAAADLEETVDYIDHALFNPDASEHLLEQLEKELLNLAEFPESHARTEDPFLAEQGIRFVTVKNYLLFYTIDAENQAVYIIRFLYGKRDWINVLKTGFSIL